MHVQRSLKKLHRVIGLSAIGFWFLQVAAGMAIETVWLTDGIRYREPAGRPNPKILGQRLEGVVAEGARFASLWAAGTVPGQFKIFYQDRAGDGRVRRLDRRGDVLYDVPGSDVSNVEGLFSALSNFHEAFLCGPVGNWAVAVSGVLLCTNLVLGLRLALRGRLWRALVPSVSGPPAARRYQMHRAVGLWIIFPAFVAAASGAVLGACDGWVLIAPSGGRPPFRATGASGRTSSTPAGRAIELALARHPGSQLSALTLPTTPDGWYEVLLHAPDEMARFWGTTRVYVRAKDGAVEELTSDEQPRSRRILEAVYPIHSGQVGGLVGRLAALAVGAALVVALAFGVLLWNARRATKP